MPNIGFGEILIILVLALVIFGPKRLPDMGRSIGKSMREFRRAASDLRSEIETDLDVEEPRRVPSRSARTRPAATGGGAADEVDAGDPTEAAETPEPRPGQPDEAHTSEADRKTSSGDPTGD